MLIEQWLILPTDSTRPTVAYIGSDLPFHLGNAESRPPRYQAIVIHVSLCCLALQLALQLSQYVMWLLLQQPNIENVQGRRCNICQSQTPEENVFQQVVHVNLYWQEFQFLIGLQIYLSI